MNVLRQIVVAVMIVVPASLCAQERPVPVRPQRVLLLGQKPDSHPVATHEYMAGIRVTARLLAQARDTQTVVVQADSPWKDGPELLDGADAVVVFLTEGARWVTEDPQRLAAFQRLAKRGGGLTCLHWGMGAREAGPIQGFAELFGSCHGGPDRKYAVVSVTAAPHEQHPILAGIEPFEVRDEFYYKLKVAVPAANHKRTSLIRVMIDDADQTVAWASERPDEGRSFGFSGLHYHENWKLKEYRRLVLQGILWTLKHPIPQNGMAVDLNDDEIALPAATPRK